MRGTEVTQADLDCAAQFLAKTAKGPALEEFAMKRDDLIRLLAWYGRIRRDGDGSGNIVDKGENRRY